MHLKHLSSTGKIKDYGPSGNSGQFAELFGRKYFQNHTLSGKAFLDRRAVHFYGYKPSDFGDTVINKDDLKQRYLVIGAEAGFGSNYATDDKLNHSFGLSWYNLTDLYKVKESKVRLSADLNKKYDLLKLGGKQTLGLNTSLSFLSQSDSITKIRSSLLYLNPYITATYKEYSFRAGIGFYVAADSVTNAHIYPMLEAKLELIPAALQLYAGIDGGMERLSVKELSEQNPFMSSRMVMQYSYNKFRAYGGFNSNISRSFNFNGSISSSSCENYPFFVPDFNSALRNNFTLLYDDISVMKLKAEVEFVKADKLRLGLSGGYYNYYKLGNQQHAWYKPDYDAALAASYLMQDKIILKLRLGLNGPVWAKSPVLPDNPASAGIIDLTEKIPAWTDLSLGAEYRFSKAFSAWLNLNNLTNSRHLYWTNYPSYRLNFLGGLSYSF